MATVAQGAHVFAEHAVQRLVAVDVDAVRLAGDANELDDEGVQPIQRAFEAIPANLTEAAAVHGLSRWQTLWRVELPLAWPGILSASVLTFVHTLGEFGVVLMVGGNIPGETRVLSVAIYDHVEAGEFAEAHRLAAGMVVFALVVLVTLYVVNRPRRDDAEAAR